MSRPEEPRITPMAWIVFLTGCVYYLYQYILRITPGVLSSELLEAYSWQATAVGAVSAAYFYAYTPMQVPVGVLMDQHGPRRLFILGTSLLAASISLMYFSYDLVEVRLLHFLIGFGSSFAYIGTSKLAAEWFPSKYFATLVGVISTFGMLGSAFGSNALVALSTRFDVDTVNLVLAVVGVLIVVLVLIFVKDSPSARKRITASGKVSTDEVVKTLGRIVKKPRTWLASALNFIVTVPTAVIAGFAGITILMKLHGLSLEEAAFVNSMIFIGAIVGAPGVAALATAIGRRKAVLTTAIVVAGLCLSLLILLPSLPYKLLIVLFLLVGFTSSGCIALTIAIGKEAFDNSMAGMVVAVINMAGMTAPMVLQPLISGAMDGTPEVLREALAFIPGLFLVAYFLAVYGKTDVVPASADTTKS